MALRCPSCGDWLRLVRVHGHGQCAACGSNVEPCCSGAGGEADEASGPELSVAPGVFEALFAAHGATAASLTEDALLQGLALGRGVSLDDARLLLEAAEHAGVVRRSGAGCFRLADARPPQR